MLSPNNLFFASQGHIVICNEVFICLISVFPCKLQKGGGDYLFFHHCIPSGIAGT